MLIDKFTLTFKIKILRTKTVAEKKDASTKYQSTDIQIQLTVLSCLYSHGFPPSYRKDDDNDAPSALQLMTAAFGMLGAFSSKWVVSLLLPSLVLAQECTFTVSNDTIIPLVEGYHASTMEQVLAQLLEKQPAHSRPQHTIVEVGAHDGTEARLAVNSGYQVVSFEPNPTLFEKLHNYTGAAKSSVVFHNMACSDTDGHMQFCIIKGAGSTSSHLMTPKDRHRCGGRLQSVPVTTLNTFFPHLPDIYVLKVDTEGFDGLVLQGASKLLSGRKVQTIILEFNPKTMIMRTGVDPVGLLGWLDCLGFALHPLTVHTVGHRQRLPFYKKVARDSIAAGAQAYVRTLVRYGQRHAIGIWTDILAIRKWSEVTPALPSIHPLSSQRA